MVETLSLREVSHKADQLVARIETEYGKPDLVVAIAKGGLYLGNLIASATRSQLKWIEIGKDLDLENLYGNKLIPYQLARVIHGYRFMTRPPRVRTVQEMPDVARLIALIDDTVHTGQTMKLAYEVVKEKFPDALIVTAAVNSVRGEGADIVLHSKKRLWFPWSKQSKEYQEYEKRLTAMGLGPVNNSRE